MDRKKYEEIKNKKEQYKTNNNKYKCPVCLKLFSNKGFVIHLFKQHVNADNGIKNSGGNNGHYYESSYKNSIKIGIKRYIDNKFGEKIEREVECCKCGKKFTVVERKEKEKYFCSRVCANSHFVTDEHKKKVANTLKNLPKKIIPCLLCGKEIEV